MSVNPLEDGTKHCNIYYKAKSPLGRMLSPPYEASFEHPEHGRFQSVGGYWCWLLFGREDGFREMSGDQMFINTEHTHVDVPPSEVQDARRMVKTNKFQEKILHATWQKIRQNSIIFWRFEQNILPFRRYMIMDGTIYRPSEADWLTDGLTVMQDYIDQHFW